MIEHLQRALWAATEAKAYLMIAMGHASAVESLTLLPMVGDMAATCNGIEALIAAKRDDAIDKASAGD